MMPYAFENRRVNLLPGADRRIKMTEADENDVKARYAAGQSIRAIARAYDGRCSRRLIQFILFPDRREQAAVGFKKRQLDGRYYQRERHKKYMRKHRQHVKKVLEKTKRSK